MESFETGYLLLNIKFLLFHFPTLKSGYAQIQEMWHVICGKVFCLVKLNKKGTYLEKEKRNLMKWHSYVRNMGEEVERTYTVLSKECYTSWKVLKNLQFWSKCFLWTINATIMLFAYFLQYHLPITRRWLLLFHRIIFILEYFVSTDNSYQTL